MKKLFIVWLFLSQLVIAAQTKSIEFGVISQEEIDMTHYEPDKEAKAVILYDKGESEFFLTDGGYSIRFIKHKRTKVFDKSETQYAEVEIPFYTDGYGKTEQIKSIEAITYNIVDGKLIKKRLNPATIYEERITNRWSVKKFVFPDVQDGAILEYRYEFVTPFKFNLPDWTFQHKIPTVYSEYQVSMIPFFEYVFLIQGVKKFDYQNSYVAKEKKVFIGNNRIIDYQDYVHIFVLEDIPAFKDESYISSVEDYIIKMDFQLAKLNRPNGVSEEIQSTWPELNKDLLKHDKFGKYIKSCGKFAKKVLEKDLILENKSEKEKAKEIIEYVKHNFEWDGIKWKYASQSAKSFFTKKKGNDADINLFMIALLNEAGIETKPLILSTRDHGKIPNDYPFNNFTNYIIALVNTEKPFLADGTEDLLPYNKLPLRCFNEKGLVVEKQDPPSWISLNNSVLSTEKNTFKIKIDPTTWDATALVSIQETQYAAYLSRLNLENDTTKIKKYYAEKIGDIKKIRTTGFSNLRLPYSAHFKTVYETEKLGDLVVLQPFLNLPPSKNPFTQEERAYPIDFIYPRNNQFDSTIEIPSNFSVQKLPDAYHIENELVNINLVYSIKGNNIKVNGNYLFKKSIYQPGEYAQIKEYSDEITKRFNESIVIEKK